MRRTLGDNVNTVLVVVGFMALERGVVELASWAVALVLGVGLLMLLGLAPYLVGLLSTLVTLGKR